MESLPAGPMWCSTEIKLGQYKTESLMTLYWHDGLEVIKYLYSNPIFANSIKMTPYCLYDDHNGWTWSEFMGRDKAWRIQVHSSL